MLNQVILVGKAVEEIEKKSVLLEIEEETIEVFLEGDILKQAKQYVKEGSTVGVSGKLTTFDGELFIVAKKITFIQGEK